MYTNEKNKTCTHVKAARTPKRQKTRLDKIRSDYKLNFTAKTIIIYALHQSTTSFGVLLHHQADVGIKATRLIPQTLVSQCMNQSPLFIEIIGQSRGLLNQSYISEYKFSEPASFSACLGVASHSKLASSHHPSSRSGRRRR